MSFENAGDHQNPSYEGNLNLPDGTPIVNGSDPHDCYFPSGWHHPYPHPVVAAILENGNGEIAMIKRRPDEPDEGGKIALPGGYVELGQRLSEAVEIEIREETGYEIAPGTLERFAILDGPTTLPGRAKETHGNIVTVFTGQAGEQVQEHDDEVTDVLWVPKDALPPSDEIAFDHRNIIGMRLRHEEEPFTLLPIVPSEMDPDELFPHGWPLE
ncbi:MAG TPA: NUDIX domain-containing protein [Candidatus Saccharimonadales bacterium]|jgi:8-oxo-dGTP diphosphatase|nr:NUDIX domain-containing protein [Candidatus Saccharimonadales bacterium]